MHDCSPRRQHRFLTVPCGADLGQPVESDFFGHVRGAFTGADRDKVGKFEAVGNGTILLDEIDTLGLEQQASLLRVIETGEFEPVGSNETQHCTARLIVASNWDLEEAVEQGKFRAGPLLSAQRHVVPPAAAARARAGHRARWRAAWRRASTRSSTRTCSTSAPRRWTPWKRSPGRATSASWKTSMQQAVLVSTGPELLLRASARRGPRAFEPARDGHVDGDRRVRCSTTARADGAQCHSAGPDQQRLQPLPGRRLPWASAGSRCTRR